MMSQADPMTTRPTARERSSGTGEAGDNTPVAGPGWRWDGEPRGIRVGVFLSTFVNKVDKKGRVSVPAPFRSALGELATHGIVALPSSKYPCIDAFSFAKVEEISRSIASLDLYSDDADDLALTMFAEAQQLAFDGEGRVMLPQTLAEHAGIADQAAFVGLGAFFQIWAPERVRTRIDQAHDRRRRLGTTLKLGPQGGGAA